MRIRDISKFSLINLIAFVLIFSSAVFLNGQEKDFYFSKHFKWREIGPANPGGRITDIEAVESNPIIIYAGAATGGLWKTVNAGITWEPIFDDQPNASIGDLAISRSDPNVIYVGTGEPNNRNSSPWGSGVFKSTDAGKTWKFIGLKETRHIGRIIVDPQNSDVVYIAALGHLWGTNKERGLFKSIDGGRTWENVLFLDERTGITDIAMDPENGDIIYAAAHERLRDHFDAGDPVNQWGPKAGIYVTSDGGQSWTKAKTGLPTNEMGRIGIAAARSKSGVVYALVSTKSQPGAAVQARQSDAENKKLEPNQGGIFKSTDYGKTWLHMNRYNNRPSYYSQIRVDPNDENVIWIACSPLAYSSDGGKTVKSGRAVQGPTHIDYHAIWIDPNNSDHVLVGGDGGINITYDRGKKWEMIKEIGLAQFYAITADMRRPYYVYGGLQDNGNWGGPSHSKMPSGITNNDWFCLSNADGFVFQIDPTDFNIVYYETQGGNATRVDLRTGVRKRIRPVPPIPKEGEKRERYRFDWNTPMLLSPHNPHTLYIGGNKLFKSVNQGDSWLSISPDLTANPDNRNTAIVSIDESPLAPGIIWAGTNDGNVWLTKDGGAEWTKLNKNIPNTPLGFWVKRLEASNHEPGRAYLVFDGHRHNDINPYIFVTNDFGNSWENITNNLPEGSIYVVREDHNNEDLLFVGSEFAVYISIDRGETWSRFMNGLPTVPVHDLYIHPRDNDLIAGTHGRGAWIMDNITPLQQFKPDVQEKDIHVFNIRREVLWTPIYDFPWGTDKEFKKANAPTGSKITYFLKKDLSDYVEIEISDIMGNVLRNLKGSKQAGLNSVIWDFRKNPPPPPKKTNPNRPRRSYRIRRGALVNPGEYLVRFKADDQIFNAKLVVEKDNIGYIGR